MRIIIPARAGSKGLPFKNRKLFKHTANIIPDIMKHKTYVVTDDEEIKLMAIEAGFKALHRPDGLSQDETSTIYIFHKHYRICTNRCKKAVFE